MLALLFDVAVLYVTLGFRQFSHYFTDLREALDNGDDDEVRRLLAEWLHLDASELPHTEVLRHVVEHALLAAHRHVFGVFFWFIVCSALGLGPAGAVLYRMAEFVSRYWAYRLRALDAPDNDRLLEVSRRVFGLIDLVPARLTAFGFAVVGNFEEAVNGWRRDARLWQQPNEGIILAAAAGAVGVQLGGAAAPGVTPDRSKTFSGGAAGAGAAEGSTAGVPLQSRPSAKRGRPGVALGGAVDAAAGAADAGQPPRLSRVSACASARPGSRHTAGSAAARSRRAPRRRSTPQPGSCRCMQL